MKKKITDKERLDFLETLHCTIITRPRPHKILGEHSWYFEADELRNRKGEKTWVESDISFRDVVDAAIRASRSGGKR